MDRAYDKRKETSLKIQYRRGKNIKTDLTEINLA
jgi:hypothetical protein